MGITDNTDAASHGPPVVSAQPQHERECEGSQRDGAAAKQPGHALDPCFRVVERLLHLFGAREELFEAGLERGERCVQLALEGFLVSKRMDQRGVRREEMAVECREGGELGCGCSLSEILVPSRKDVGREREKRTRSEDREMSVPWRSAADLEADVERKPLT